MAVVCFGAAVTTIVPGPSHSLLPAVLFLMAAAGAFWQRRAWKRSKRNDQPPSGL
jgi:hypothetical protein